MSAGKPTLGIHNVQPDTLAPRARDVLRIVAAAMFFCHGVQKLVQFHVPPGSLPWFAALIECIGAPLLLAGFLTRPVAFVLSGEMAVAYFTQHAPNGWLPLQNRGELAVLYCFLYLYLAAAGAGPWSIDAWLARRRQP